MLNSSEDAHVKAMSTFETDWFFRSAPSAAEPPSQGWKTFLRNHADGIAAVDFLVVPTLTFERLFAFVILGVGRRNILWIGVTTNPTAQWLAHQITEAFPWDTAPTFLIRDNDCAYGAVFTRRVRSVGIRDRPYSASIAMAELICRARNRLDPT